MLQLAAYLGFDEIYLLGVDHSNQFAEIRESSHFEGYLTENEMEFYESKGMRNYRANVDLAYQKAERHALRNGFRIYNATRGGELETFKRVDFDSLFRGE
jgi:hypothetical protein